LAKSVQPATKTTTKRITPKRTPASLTNSTRRRNKPMRAPHPIKKADSGRRLVSHQEKKKSRPNGKAAMSKE